jgi:hypothetical protein
MIQHPLRLDLRQMLFPEGLSSQLNLKESVSTPSVLKGSTS